VPETRHSKALLIQAPFRQRLALAKLTRCLLGATNSEIDNRGPFRAPVWRLLAARLISVSGRQGASAQRTAQVVHGGIVAVGNHQVAQPDGCADMGCGSVRGHFDASAQFAASHITASTTTTPITRYAAPAFGMAPFWWSVTVSM